MNSSNVIGAFSEVQVESLTGLSKSQLRRWRRDGFIKPSYDDGGKSAFSHVYSFKDLVNLRVLNTLRNTHKVSLSELKKAGRELSHLGDDRWTATTLYVLNRHVVFVEPETNRKREITTKQYVADIPLKVAIQNARQAVQQFNDEHRKAGQAVRNRYVSQNFLVFAGTRIPVAAVREFAEAGYTPEQIIGEYPDLTDADVKMAVSQGANIAA
jgi:DNA-binding transcriptional MerR regulator